MSGWTFTFTKQAQKDARLLAQAGLKAKGAALLALLEQDPFTRPPSYEKLSGDLAGSYSRRITITHRLVYDVYPDERVVRVLRMWSHYGQ